MPPKAPTTVVFVPGAWHNPRCYDVVVHQIKQAGYSTSLVTLASVGAAIPILDWSADVARIRTRIQEAADKGNEVVVCAHSYGGLPASEAVKGLNLAARREQGLKGGVSHMFFCCSFLIPEGLSLFEAGGRELPPWCVVSEDGMESICASPAETFYNDLPADEQEAAVAMLKPFSYQCNLSTVTYAAWKDVPSTYLHTLQDATVPFQLQKLIVEEWAKGYNVRTETVDASHSPFYSHPEFVANAIRRAAGEAV